MAPFTRLCITYLLAFILAVLVCLNFTSVTLPHTRPHLKLISTTKAYTPTVRTENKLPATTSCSSRPNVILSAVDGSRWQDQIFLFMQSLELSLGRESLHNIQQHSACPPIEVQVKILIPPRLAKNLPTTFKSLVSRYPSLEFVGALPESDAPVVIRRFEGFSEFVGQSGSSWNKILVCDLDVIFQRDPFGMKMEPGVELHYFAEWRGLKIGQCNVHMGWFDACANTPGTPYISHQQSDTYRALDRVCAGSIYGTAKAMAVYLRVMTAELRRSGHVCNDQAVHTHIFYSKLLDAELARAGIGKAWKAPNEEALLGNVGTTPFVRFNDWGEILNDNGQVQHAVHQYKTHSRLSQIVWNRYGWMTELSDAVVPPSPNLIVDTEWNEKDGHQQMLGSPKLQRFRLENATAGTCAEDSSLCSCKYSDCQMDYAEFAL